MELLLLFCLCFISTGLAQKPCTTPNGEAARCVPYRHCPAYFEELKGKTHVSNNVIDFLRASTCAHTTSPWICCGSRMSYGRISPLKKLQLQTLNVDTDPKQHRNYHLLPRQCGVHEIDEKILGGTEAELDEFPWMALLEYKNKNGNSVGHGCGGILISSRYVLTAAHCVTQEALTHLGEVFRVRLGEHDLTTPKEDCRDKVEGTYKYTVCSEPTQDIDVEAVIAHPDFNLDGVQKYNDIALIRLKTAARITGNVKPICLPLNGERSEPNKRLFVAGWGNTSNTTFRFSDVKMKVTLPLYTNENCNQIYNKFSRKIQESQLCAGGEDNMDSCNGDSGGPIMTPRLRSTPPTWYVEGVVSYGPKQCGLYNVPGVYTRVSSYINWILDNID